MALFVTTIENCICLSCNNEEVDKKNLNKNSDTSLTVGVTSNPKTVSCGLIYEISSIRNRMKLSLISAEILQKQ
jgi:hypothetical protein